MSVATCRPIAAEKTPSGGDTGAEQADVEKIKEKYWARGNETEMGVVQNRLYPKRHRFELGIQGGSLSGDPFLSMYSVGASLGFHFSEFFAVHVMAWKAFVSPSSALTTLEQDTNTTANTNGPKYFVGGETRASVLYGKLSLLGAAILYFDAYFSAGAGQIATDSGNNFLLSAGIGQQIHLSRLFSVNLDYKFLYYKETVIGQGGQSHVNTNLSSLFSIGLSVFLDPFSADAKG